MRVAMCAVCEYGDRAGMLLRGCCLLCWLVVVVEKSVVATTTVAYVFLCLCAGVGGRRPSCRVLCGSKQAGSAQASKQAGKQASKRAKARQGMNEWIEGILWLGIVAQSRMCVRRGC